MDWKKILTRFAQMYLVLLIIGFLFGVYTVLSFNEIISALQQGTVFNLLMLFLFVLISIAIPFVFVSYFKLELKEALITGILYSIIPFVIFLLFQYLVPFSWDSIWLFFHSLVNYNPIGSFTSLFCFDYIANCMPGTCKNLPIHCSNEFLQIIISTILVLIASFAGTKIKLRKEQ